MLEPRIGSRDTAGPCDWRWNRAQLKALYERRPGFQPVAVAGISIGAITAAVLGGAKGDPISAATKVGTGEIEFFDSRRPGGLTFEHVAASGSLPHGFPMTDIEGEW